MPKFTVFASEVTFFRATIEAANTSEIRDMDSDDIPYVEYDGEGMEIQLIELNGEQVV